MVSAGLPALRLVALLDPTGESWPSMDLAGDELVAALGAWPAEVRVRALRPPLSGLGRRLLGPRQAALNADRLLTRFGRYPVRALLARPRAQAFHIADQVYAHLAHVLPARRTGVYCHDLDAFASLLDPAAPRRAAWFRAMTRATLSGLERAAVVFHSTAAVRAQILAAGVVDPARLVHAPMGVAAAYRPEPAPDEAARVAAALPGLGGRPFLLHVGSELARKRLDVLVAVVAAVRATRPDLQLVQVGAVLAPALRDDPGVRGALHQPGGRLDRAVLAALYRRAEAVLVTSEAEGFGLPVIEALACGAPVVASDLPVLREVGGPAVGYSPVGDVPAWAGTVTELLDGSRPAPPRSVRLEQAGRFTWARQARTVLDAYLRLLPD